jgi:hypothetical protein
MEELVHTMTEQQVRGRGKKATAATVDLNELRARIGDVLNQLGAQMMGRVTENSGEGARDVATDPETADLQSRTAPATDQPYSCETSIRASPTSTR